MNIRQRSLLQELLNVGKVLNWALGGGGGCEDVHPIDGRLRGGGIRACPNKAILRVARTMPIL